MRESLTAMLTLRRGWKGRHTLERKAPRHAKPLGHELIFLRPIWPCTSSTVITSAGEQKKTTHPCKIKPRGLEK